MFFCHCIIFVFLCDLFVVETLTESPMKHLLYISIVVCFTLNSSFGQFEPTIDECDLITKLIEDDVRNVKKVISKHEIRINDLNSGDLYQLVMMRNAENYSYIIRSLDKNCFDKDTKVTFHFRDGSALKFVSHNQQNCQGLLLVNMGGFYRGEETYETFLNSYIIGVGFETQGKDEVRLKIETPHTELIQEVFECLIVAEDRNRK